MPFYELFVDLIFFVYIFYSFATNIGLLHIYHSLANIRFAVVKKIAKYTLLFVLVNVDSSECGYQPYALRAICFFYLPCVMQLFTCMPNCGCIILFLIMIIIFLKTIMIFDTMLEISGTTSFYFVNLFWNGV